MADPEETIVVGERPFTAEERYKVRLLLTALGELSITEMKELAQLAHTGRAARTAIVFFGRLIGYIGAGLTALIAYRTWKGGA